MIVLQYEVTRSLELHSNCIEEARERSTSRDQVQIAAKCLLSKTKSTPAWNTSQGDFNIKKEI